MEFLLVVGANADGFARGLDLAPSRFTTQEIHHQHAGRCHLFTTGEGVVVGDQALYFDGYCAGSSLISGSTVPADMAAELLVETPSWGMSAPRGMYCAVAWTPRTGAFRVTNDPLSQYPVFWTRQRGVWFIANNIFFIRAALAAAGITLERTAELAVLEGIINLGTGDMTGWQGIELMPPGTAWEGDGKKARSRWFPTAFSTPVEKSREAYEAAKPRAIQNVVQFAEWLGERARHEKVVMDLTGGKDSRMILAALVAAGVQQRLTYFCDPSAESSDLVAVNPLFKRFGLQPANFYVENLDEPIDAIERARRALYRYQGSAFGWIENVGRVSLGGQSRVHGGWGELARSFFGLLPRPWQGLRKRDEIKRDFERYGWAIAGSVWAAADSPRFVGHAWASYLATRGNTLRPLLTDSFLRSTYRRVRRLFQNIADTGVPAQDLVDVFYATDRIRRYLGTNARARMLVRPTFDPLADPALLLAARTLPHAERHSCRFIYDFITELVDEELTLLPLANATWPATMATYAGFDAKRLPPSIPNQPVDALPIVQFGERRPNPARLPGCYGFLDHALLLREHAHTLAASLSPQHACWNILQRDAILQHLNDADWIRSHQGAYRVLYLMHAFMWLHGEEKNVPISGTVVDDIDAVTAAVS